MDQRTRDVWNAMLDADMNVRYWHAKISAASNTDTYARIGVAVLSSGTVAGLFWSQGYSDVLKGFSLVTAIVNIALATIDPKKRIEEMAEFKRSWAEFRAEYERLWAKRKAPTEADGSHFHALRLDQAKRTVHEAKYKEDRKLLLRCMHEVRKSRGLGERKKQ